MRMMQFLLSISLGILTTGGFTINVKGNSDPIVLARWNSDTTDTIGITDGEIADIYDINFSLIQSFTLPPIENASQISYQASVWSPNLKYIQRVVLFDDTYTGSSPNKTILQIWQPETQQLMFEYSGFSFRSGAVWNNQSTKLAVVVPTDLGTDKLVILNSTGNQDC